MVFPRKAGFGRCYLVLTRHEILSNINRNLTGTQLRLRKNRNQDKSRESANPIPVLLLSFESQTVVFQLFDFHLRKFQKFIIRTIGQARIHTGCHRFTEIGRIFHNKYILSNKNNFQFEIWKMLDSPRIISTTMTTIAISAT